MLEIRRDVAADIAAARRWYEEQRVGLGSMFEDDTVAVMHTRRHPRTWQVRERQPAYVPPLLAA